MTDVPTDIKAMREAGTLLIQWGDEQSVYPFVFLRGQCECAHCVNEWTGERILDPATISTDIVIDKMELVGSYAVRVHWSDGHSAGLYTWKRLAELRDCL